MTTTCLDDTLPLPSDDEKTYYGSDLSFSEESEEGSIQLLYKIINLENSICMLGASEYSDLVKKRQRRQYQYTYFS